MNSNSVGSWSDGVLDSGFCVFCGFCVLCSGFSVLGVGTAKAHVHPLCGGGWCGVVWCTPHVVWCGVVWCGVVWCGVEWSGVVWCGVVGEWWQPKKTLNSDDPSPEKGVDRSESHVARIPRRTDVKTESGPCGAQALALLHWLVRHAPTWPGGCGAAHSRASPCKPVPADG